MKFTLEKPEKELKVILSVDKDGGMLYLYVDDYAVLMINSNGKLIKRTVSNYYSVFGKPNPGFVLDEKGKIQEKLMLSNITTDSSVITKCLQSKSPIFPFWW